MIDRSSDQFARTPPDGLSPPPDRRFARRLGLFALGALLVGLVATCVIFVDEREAVIV